MPAKDQDCLNAICFPPQIIDAPGLLSSFIIYTQRYKVAQFFIILTDIVGNFSANVVFDDGKVNDLSDGEIVQSNFLSYSENQDNLIIEVNDTDILRSVGYVGKNPYVRINLDIGVITSAFLCMFCILDKPLVIPNDYVENVSPPPPTVTSYRVTNLGDLRWDSFHDPRIVIQPGI